MTRARNREMLALIPVALLLTAGFAAVFAQENSKLGNLSLTYGAYFFAVCLATHFYLRIRLPHADPYLFPLMALLTAFGLVMIYRIDESLARDQANWFVFGLILFALTIQFLRDYEVLERYRYIIATAGILLLLAPRLPGIGEQVNGAYLGVKVGPISFQPAEFAKLAIVVFLASYLRENREVLIVGARRILGVTLPPIKHFGPMLVVWGATMVLLVFIRDLGSSLMFFVAFLALLYVATGRFSFVVIGMVLFLAGAWFIVATVPHVHDRVEVWLHPYHEAQGNGYQILQSIFAQADGGLFGKGFGQGLITIPGSNPPSALLPAAQTDTIYSLIVNELGLFGACGLIATYLLITARGFKVALLANDGFSKLLATGLTAVFAIQAFVIIGGVTRVIPLTGVTLPFVSYGGSSIVANFVLLALLLLVSDRARREVEEGASREDSNEPLGALDVNRQIIKLFGFIVVLFGVLVAFTAWWSVFDAKNLKAQEANKRPLFEQQQIPRGRILAADGSVIAKSVPKGKGTGRRYVRHYPMGRLFGHPIGYSFMEYGQTEFEQSHNSELTGEESEFGSILNELTGQKQEGEQVVTSLDPHAQEVALHALEGAGYGAVVAIEPSTGAVKVLASSPTYNPNAIPDEKKFKELNNPNSIARPLYNRATQGQYPPGSTFKVVTAAAGLESGVITPETTINAPGAITDEGHELANDYNQDWGSISLDTALTNSVNTWFAQLGQKLGQDKLFSMMEKFGFNSKPPIDLPEDELSKSGVYDYETERMLTRRDPVDLGRVAIGQERLLVTPLQDAMVAAAVANGGKLMKPQIWKRVVNVDGSVTKKMDPSVYSEPISSKTAAELTTAMEGVVSEGTGTNAAISGVPVAGKTGTAETPGNKACGGGSEENQAWFIGFAPADHPKIAIAASVECTTAFGNDAAAPIFREVAETILAGE